MIEIGIGLICSSVYVLFKSISFSSFDLNKQLLSTCRTLGLSVQYGDEIALPQVNAEYPQSWGTRLLVGLPTGLSSQKVIDQKQAIAEALRVNVDDIEMTYKNDGLVIDIFTVPMPDKVPYVRSNENSYKVLIGVNRRGEERHYDFNGPYPHLLIAGIAGGGKSVILRSILTTLATGPKPDLYLCDLKGGVELGMFRNLEHVEGFASTLEDLRRVAYKVINEMKRRYEIMSEEDSQQWVGKKVVFVMDELADLKTRAGDPDAKLKNEIKGILTQLSAKGRAAGVIIVLATQRPSADVVDGLIKTNIASSVCFRTRDGVQSRIILDNTSAEALPDIPGRLIFQTAHDETLQGPFLSADEARRIIATLPKKQVREEIVHVINSEPDRSEAFSLDRNFIEL